MVFTDTFQSDKHRKRLF